MILLLEEHFPKEVQLNLMNVDLLTRILDQPEENFDIGMADKIQDLLKDKEIPTKL